MNVLYEQTLYKGKGHWTIKAVEDYTGGLGPETGYLISYASTENGKVTEKFNATKGKNKGRSNETTAATQAVMECKSRVDKQRDKGYVDTREEALGGEVTNQLGKKLPQLSQPIKKFKGEIDWSTAYLQPKFDGHRTQHDEFLYTRGGERANVAHIQAAIDAQPTLKALHLDGELYVHGLHLNNIGSLISKPQPDSLRLEYWLYDIVSDAAFEDRIRILQQAYAACSQLDVRICLSPTHKVTSMAQAQALHDQWVAEGYEGSILKWGDEGYQDGKRSPYSIKLKDFDDAEFKIVGITYGKTNAGGQLNPNWVYEFHPFGDTSKPVETAEVLAYGTHAEKHQQGLEAETRFGQLAKLSFFGYTSKGTPNIATMLGWYEPL